MPRLCRVSVKDLNAVEHTVTVHACSLFEAVALGLVQIKKHEWVADIATGLTTELAEATVKHTVAINDFQKWLATTGRSPRDITQRQRVREILGRKT